MLLLFQPNLSDKPAALKTPAWEEESYFQPRRVFASLGVALVVASSFNPAFRQVRFDTEDYSAGARKFAPVAAQVQSTKTLSRKLPSLEEDQYANSPRRAFAPVSSVSPITPVINSLRQFWTFEGEEGVLLLQLPLKPRLTLARPKILLEPRGKKFL